VLIGLTGNWLLCQSSEQGQQPLMGMLTHYYTTHYFLNLPRLPPNSAEV
jgi:hypothetical protein